MTPEIINTQPIYLAGFSFFGDPFHFSDGWTEENEIGRLWNRFMFWLQKNNPDLFTKKMYEVHIEHPETLEKGHYEIFVGYEIKDLNSISHELLIKCLPAVTYAQFTIGGEQISSDWGQLIYNEWLQNSPWERAHTYGIQIYDHRFKGLDKLEESEIDVQVPIRKKTTS